MHFRTGDDVAQLDPWQIDPVTARIRPADSLSNPVIVVVEATPSLSVAITEICEFLHVGIISVNEPREIQEMLGEMQPIAILHEAPSVDCALYDLLMVVAGYDPGMPVLIVLPDDPHHQSALDGAQRLWQLTDIVRLGQRPGIRALIDFLFHAGRKFGRTRFMPV